MYSDYYWLNHKSEEFLKKGYLSQGETAKDRIKSICDYAESILKIDGFAKKLESYIAKGWMSLSSPVWANFANGRGCPISCFNSFIPDTMDGILTKVSEVGMMTKIGGGTSAYFGALRPRGAAISVGGSSNGPVHFMQLFDKVASVVAQNSVRRGAFAAYLDVEHPDILEFLKIRSEGNPIQEMSFGVCISDDWMNSMSKGDKGKRNIWSEIVKKRFETGYPYLFFTDNVNNSKPKVYKDKNSNIYSANLCAEVLLPSKEDESFVCDLSSLNLLHYDDWKNTDLVQTVIFFLDAVMTDFINKARTMPYMEAAYNFAVRHRALGLGTLGWHSLLQSKLIPFESMEAKLLNVEIFKCLDKKSLEATKELAKLFGEPEVLKGYGQRNTTRLAIAPNTASGFILGQISPSIEPLDSNYFVKDLAKGRFTYKNPFLKKELAKIGKDTPEIWESILVHGGSVQHLDFLDQNTKDVFKTFGEISQKEVVIQAAARQKYIDQGQSLNVMIPLDVKPKEVSDLLIEGWRLGIKTFYYQRGANPAQNLSRSIMTCKSCEA